MCHAHPITVEKYHAMIGAGVLGENNRCELVEARLVVKPRRTPSRSYATGWLAHWLDSQELRYWFADSQKPITIPPDSEPEPDVTVIRGAREEYREAHPLPDQVLLLVEVAEAMLNDDRTVKKRLYARAGILVYWLVNLIDKQIEVYTVPSGPGDKPDFGDRRVVTAAWLLPRRKWKS